MDALVSGPAARLFGLHGVLPLCPLRSDGPGVVYPLRAMWLALALGLTSLTVEAAVHLGDLLFWGLVLWSGGLGAWPSALWAILTT